MGQSTHVNGPSILLGLTLSMSMASAANTWDPVGGYAINCTNIGAIRSSSCWETLNLTEYLLNWEPPQCTTTVNDSGCCNSSETWSTCFLRLATGDRDWNCTAVSANTQTCNINTESVDRSLDPSILAKASYILHNIVAVNEAFSFYPALNPYLASYESLMVQPIINQLSPPKAKKLIISNVLDALTAGLTFVSPQQSDESPSSLTITSGFATGLQKAPGIASKIWPSDTAENITVQASNWDYDAADLESALGNASAIVLERLNAGLATLMANKTTFVAFVENGEFSGSSHPNLITGSKESHWFIGTYVVSAALTANGFYAAVTSNSNVSDPAWKSQCTYDGVNICYQDPATDLTWQLNCKGCKNAADTASHAFDPSNGWTNAQLLMQGSWNCTSDGLNLTNVVNLNADGSLNRTCPSQLPQCYSGTAACPVLLVNGTCPIAPCK